MCIYFRRQLSFFYISQVIGDAVNIKYAVIGAKIKEPAYMRHTILIHKRIVAMETSHNTSNADTNNMRFFLVRAMGKF